MSILTEQPDTLTDTKSPHHSTEIQSTNSIPVAETRQNALELQDYKDSHSAINAMRNHFCDLFCLLRQFVTFLKAILTCTAEAGTPGKPSGFLTNIKPATMNQDGVATLHLTG